MLPIENTHVSEVTPLVSPAQMKRESAPSEQIQSLVVSSREQIRAMIHGRDTRRLMVVVGPCSIHDAGAAYDYAKRLGEVARATGDQLMIVMRTYFEKPRTVGGWKGLISDPRLDGSCDVPAGLALARSVLLAITGIGLPCATEFLDPIVPQYVADLVTWAAIGARTTESQTHRQMASGFSMPVGFKNSTDGSLQNAINAVLSARCAHAFLGINADGMTAVVKTTGNPDGHVVLRGGAGGANYHSEDIASAIDLVAQQGMKRGVIVDCSHDNSGKDHTKQAAIFAEIVQAFANGNAGILGAMIESNLLPGKQTWVEGQSPKYGVSITDSCIGWDETERLLLDASARIAAASRRR
jgi:3-deoxy-7-phosphoheptulonate synthase